MEGVGKLEQRLEKVLQQLVPMVEKGLVSSRAPTSVRRWVNANTSTPAALFALLRRGVLFGTMWGSGVLFGAVVGSQFDREGMLSYWDQTVRFARALGTVVLISADYKVSLVGLEGDRREEELHVIHRRSAQRLLSLFQRNAGIYVKAGQHINSLDYVLPTEYTTAMVPLLDHASTMAFRDLQGVFETDLHKSAEELFAFIDPVPVAAASLAQVHRARLWDGREVAVKVQFPGLQRRCEGDVRTIDMLTRLVTALFPEFKLQWLVDEFNKNLPLELDFLHEARNSERVAHNFAGRDDFYVPKVMWSLTSSRVLTMEYIHGVRPDKTESLRMMGLSIAAVARLLADVFNEQIFRDGFVHCDPHPGNILIRPAPSQGWLSRLFGRPRRPQLVLLDHGLYRDIDRDFRINYAHLWYALIRFDEAEIAKYCKLLNVPGDHRLLASMLTARTWNDIDSGSMDLDLTEAQKRRIRMAAQGFLVRISEILAKVPSDLLLLFKTNDLLRSLNNQLGRPINTLPLTVDACIRAVHNDALERDPSWRNYICLTAATYWWAIALRAAVILDSFRSRSRLNEGPVEDFDLEEIERSLWPQQDPNFSDRKRQYRRENE